MEVAYSPPIRVSLNVTVLSPTFALAELPGLRVDVDVLDEKAGMAALREGRVDCAIVSSDPGDPNLACTRLADLQPIVIVPRDDPLATARGVGNVYLEPKTDVDQTA